MMSAFHERQLLHSAIGPHDHRCHQIAGAIAPGAPAPAAPGGLPVGNHPMAIGKADRAFEKPVVGGTRRGEMGEG